MDTPERIAKLEAQVESIKDDVSELKSDVKEIHSRITTGNREIMDKIESMDAAMEARMAKNAETSAKQHSEIKTSLQSDINKVTERVDTLERWRWMIVGGAIVIGYIVGHLGLFSKFLG
jgi:predicted RNase H-like nuclease (RuvC/YqgF family)